MFWLGNQTCIVLNKFIVPKEALLGYVLKYRKVIFNEQKGKNKAQSLHRHSALCIIVGCSMLSMGLHVIIGHSVLSMGPTCRCWVLCAVDGSCALSMGLQFACRLVDWRTASSIRPPSRRSTRWVTNGPVISLIGPSSREFACRLVYSPAVLSMGHASR